MYHSILIRTSKMTNFVIRGAAMLEFYGDLNTVHPSVNRLPCNRQMRTLIECQLAIENDHILYGIPLEPMKAWKWLLTQGPEVFDHFRRPRIRDIFGPQSPLTDDEIRISEERRLRRMEEEDRRREEEELSRKEAKDEWKQLRDTALDHIRVHCRGEFPRSVGNWFRYQDGTWLPPYDFEDYYYECYDCH